MLRYNPQINNARLHVIRDAIDADGLGTVKIYTAPRPAQAGGAVGSATLLTTGTFQNPCAGSASQGQLTFNSISGGDAVASGQAAWGRIEAGDGSFVADATVGTDQATAEIVINTTAILDGAPVQFGTSTIISGNN